MSSRDEQVPTWTSRKQSTDSRAAEDFHTAVSDHDDFDLKECLKSIFGTVTTLISADRCSIFLYDSLENDLYTFVFDVNAELLAKSTGGAASPTPPSNVPSRKSISDMEQLQGMSLTEQRRRQMLRDYGFDAKELAIMSQSKRAVAKARTHVSRQAVADLRIPMGVGIAGHVAKTCTGIRIPDAYQDPRFNSEMDKKTGYKTQSILCLPIFGSVRASGKKQLLGVSTLINKKNSRGELTEFTAGDEEMFKQLLSLVGIGLKASVMYQESRNDELEAAKLALRNSQYYESAKLDALKAEAMLKMAKLLYKEEDVGALTKVIVNTAKEIMLADKASVFLIDHDKKLVHLLISLNLRFSTTKARRRFHSPWIRESLVLWQPLAFPLILQMPTKTPVSIQAWICSQITRPLVYSAFPFSRRAEQR